MNKKLEEFKNNIKNKKVAVIGMGVSNIPLVEYLSKLDTKITIFDKRDKEKLNKEKYNEFIESGIEFELGEKYLENLKGFDYIFRSPSMRPDIKEVKEEVERGTILTSEIEMLIELCPSHIIGITGSDGKTTTTTLTYMFLKEEGYNTYLGGNIGYPLFSKIDEMKEEDFVVLELSSFQLMTAKVCPSISAITNISPNHLDIHKDYDEYINAKKNIFKSQDENGLIILNYDNELTKNCEKDAKGKVRFFSTYEDLKDGVILKDEKDIFIKENGEYKKVISKDEIMLIGRHNLENCCTAIALTKDFVSTNSIRKVLTTFKGVEHRNELVRTIDGVNYRNDSIGSSPTRTIAGLKSFNDKVILIAGGYDKHLDYTELGEYIIKKVKYLILLGQTSLKIKEATQNAIKLYNANDVPIYEVKSLEEAVNKAYEITKIDKEIKNVFFSPASASFDMFKNFEERGNIFKELVNKL